MAVAYLKCASSIYKALHHKFISDALLMNHNRCLNVKQSLQSSSQITEYIQKRCECYTFFPNPHYICGNNFSQLIKLIIWYKITGPVFPFSRKPSYPRVTLFNLLPDELKLTEGVGVLGV